MTSSTPRVPSLAKAEWLAEPRLQRVLSVLNTGGETRIAGGAVRNGLLKLPINDVDLATTLVPRDVMQLARGAGFAVHPTGLDHGTITVVNRGAAFEVTTLRRDVTTDGRHAEVEFTASFEEDASRRDFTMNALYCSRDGHIFDYVNGCADLQARKVRFVGKAAQRIGEDYLRILRFFRFSAIYGKGALDVSGLAACRRFRKNLAIISAERKSQELLKLLIAPRAVEVLKVMVEADVLQQVLAIQPKWRVMKRLPEDAILRLYALAERPEELKEALRLSNAQAARLEALKSSPMLSPELREKEQRALLFALGKQNWDDATTFAHAQSTARRDAADWLSLRDLSRSWEIPTVPVQGKDLLALGLAAGPGLGQALQMAQDYWVASDFSATKEDLITFIESKNL